MRYTIDPIESGDDPPPLIEVAGPEKGKIIPLRDDGGFLKGGAWPTEFGRSMVTMPAHTELPESFGGLRQAIQALAYELDSYDVEINGAAAEAPDDEADARTRMRMTQLLAYAALAVEFEVFPDERELPPS